MYVLVVHTITDITAKVPFAMMVLQDAIKTKAIPSQLKVYTTRMLCSLNSFHSSTLEEGVVTLEYKVCYSSGFA